MKAFTSVLVSLCLIVKTSTGLQCADVGCPPGWVFFGNSCYRFGEDKLPWSTALNRCKEVGAHLAEVESEDENIFVKRLARMKNKDFWLGGTDAEKEGTWKWANSLRPVKLTDWLDNEPNNLGNQDCLYLLGSGSGTAQWDDNQCTRDKQYICEIRNTCPDGWKQFGTSCYQVSSDKQTFENARNKCRNQNAYLAEIFSAEENNFVKGLVKSTAGDYYLGGSDNEKEGTWKWVYGGAPFKFSDWSPSNPSGGSQNCLQLWQSKQYQWDDDYCSKEDKYICEMKVVCPTGWTHFKTSCYKFSDDKKPWAAAQEQCKEYGGYLAEVESKAETDYLEGLARPTKIDYWLGGTDAQKQGDWKWANSLRPVKYTHWCDICPNNDNYNKDDCLQLWAYKQSVWDDTDCTISKKYICEISSLGS